MRYRRCFAGIAAATWLAACGKDVGGPSLDSVAGHYLASSFATTQAGVTTNQLARGSLIDLTLVADGGTTGRLFVPASKPGVADFDASLAGTWILAGDSVTRSHVADTFLRDMPLGVAAARLQGDKTFSGVRIVVVLQKQ